MIILTDNEFFTGLSNLALFMRLVATNTSSEPENFVDSFQSETLEAGNTKIFPWADLPEVTEYSELSSLLTVTKANAGEEYLQVTEKKVIKSSFNKHILEMAFTSDSGMNDFIGYMLGQMESAKIDHLYNVIITDLYGRVFPSDNKQTKNIIQYNESEAVTVRDMLDVRQINAEEVFKQMNFDINNIQVYTTEYNELGNKEALDIKDLKLIITEPYFTNQIMDLYAQLLKSDVLNSSFTKPEMFKIPQIKVPGGQEKVIGYLLHKAAYQIFYKFTFMGDFFDVSNLCINNFLHFWYGKGWLKNLPAVKLVAVPTPIPTPAA